MEEIIIRYLEERATDAEKGELLAWLRKKENRKSFQFHRSVWFKGLEKDSYPAGGRETWFRIQSGLLEKSAEGWQKSRRLTQTLRYAAIFFFLATLGVSLLWWSQRKQTNQEVTTTIMADNGQISRAVLPDGTQVWINSGSAVSYGRDFGVKNRKISLSGEAFFDAAQENTHPLVVDCTELMIKVTGTRFNVSAIPGTSAISVVLEEGSVELLRQQNSSFHYSLKPGDMATFDLNNKKMIVTSTNTRRFTSWKEGIIHIYDQTLEEVAQRLNNRYNQEFVVNDEVKEFLYTFTIRNESLQDIIALIEKITPVEAIQEGNVITFRKGKEVPRSNGK